MRSEAEQTIEALLVRDAGGRSWLPRLLAALPRAPEALGERLVEDPGSLQSVLALRGLGGRLGAFEAFDPPAVEFLRWCVDHPDALTRADAAAVTPETARLHRALLDDDPPGARMRAQDRARELLSTRSPLTTGWWRFEDVGVLDALLQSHRLVVTVVFAPDGELRPATPWYPARTTFTRALETARRMAQGVGWGTLVIGEPELDARGLIDAGAPHLDEASRAELLGGYLGTISLATLRAVTG